MLVKILGITIGKCGETYNLNKPADTFITYLDFKPNKNMYKIFPDFPKECFDISNLTFDIIKGQIILRTLNNHINNWKKIYVVDIRLINFKGDSDA